VVLAYGPEKIHAKAKVELKNPEQLEKKEMGVEE